MPNTLTPSTPEAVAALWSSLDPANQSSLLAFARFLKSEEAQAALDVVDEEDEAAWECDFNDSAKTANFARWAEASLAHDKPKLVDPDISQFRGHRKHTPSLARHPTFAKPTAGKPS